jgi:hypothetical protein
VASTCLARAATLWRPSRRSGKRRSTPSGAPERRRRGCTREFSAGRWYAQQGGDAAGCSTRSTPPLLDLAMARQVGARAMFANRDDPDPAHRPGPWNSNCLPDAAGFGLLPPPARSAAERGLSAGPPTSQRPTPAFEPSGYRVSRSRPSSRPSRPSAGNCCSRRRWVVISTWTAGGSASGAIDYLMPVGGHSGPPQRHGAKRIRTADLLGAIQALSQLSYSPAAGKYIGRPERAWRACCGGLGYESGRSATHERTQP